MGKVEESATSPIDGEKPEETKVTKETKASIPAPRKLDLRSVVREVVALNLAGSSGKRSKLVLDKEGKLVKTKRRRKQPKPLANLNEIYKRKKNHKVDRLGQDKVRNNYTYLAVLTIDKIYLRIVIFGPTTNHTTFMLLMTQIGYQWMASLKYKMYDN